MVLAGAVSTGEIPLTFSSSVNANGVWVTAADVVQPNPKIGHDLFDKLSKIKLAILRGCADVVLSQHELARRITLQLPGVFAVTARQYASEKLLVKVDGQTLDATQIAAGVEQSKPQSCPSSVRENCEIRLTQAPDSLCLPRGQVAYRLDVTEATSQVAPLQTRVEVWVDGVRLTTLRLPAKPAHGLWAMRLKNDIDLGQAIRVSDVEPVRVSTPVGPRTRYDAMTHVVRANSDLAAGDLVRADIVRSLAVGRVHDPVVLSTQVGPVQVSRSARLASDVGPDRNTWAYFEDGGLATVGPVGRSDWELIR